MVSIDGVHRKEGNPYQYSPPHPVYHLEEEEPIIYDQDNPEESFTVLINGNEIPYHSNWKYNASANTIAERTKAREE